MTTWASLRVLHSLLVSTAATMYYTPRAPGQVRCVVCANSFVSPPCCTSASLGEAGPPGVRPVARDPQLVWDFHRSPPTGRVAVPARSFAAPEKRRDQNGVGGGSGRADVALSRFLFELG